MKTWSKNYKTGIYNTYASVKLCKKIAIVRYGYVRWENSTGCLIVATKRVSLDRGAALIARLEKIESDCQSCHTWADELDSFFDF